MEIVHFFVFLCYSKKQQRNEPIDHSLYSQTPRACTMLCNLWFDLLVPSSCWGSHRKNDVPMKSNTRFILFDYLGHNNCLG